MNLEDPHWFVFGDHVTEEYWLVDFSVACCWNIAHISRAMVAILCLSSAIIAGRSIFVSVEWAALVSMSVVIKVA